MGKSNRDETSAKSLLSLHLPKLEVNEVRDVSLGEGYRQTFGSRVRELRRARGLSQEELADRAGLHRTYLSGIERGQRNPSLKNIAAIAETLGLGLSALFSYDP